MPPKPTQFVLDYAPWSTSKASSAEQCPKRFWFTYVEKKKSPGPMNADALVGQATHTILEFMLSGRSWKLAYEAAQDKYDLTSTDLDRIRNLRFGCDDFMERYRKFINTYPPTKTWIEKKLAVDLDGNQIEFFNNKGFFRGVVDLTLIQQEPHAIIIDHKTGKGRSMHYYRDQFDGYIILAKGLIPQLEGAKVGINFVKHSELRFSELEDVTDIEPYWDKLVTRLNSCTRDTHRFEETRVSKLCNWCDHKVHCPAHEGNESSGNGQEEQKGEH